MLATRLFREFLVFLTSLCFVMGAASLMYAQPPEQHTLVFPKEDPVLSDKFRQYLTELDPQETEKVWVFFTDKGIYDSETYLSSVNRAERALTSRAAWRRSKTMGDGLVDFHDLPVSRSYIDQIITFQGKLRQRSRWLNAASFEIPAGRLQEMSELDFVRAIKPVLGGKRKPIEAGPPPQEPPQEKGLFDLNYGASYSQLQQINIPAVHNLGYYGQGVLVCMLDTGYRKNHLAFQAAFAQGRVLAEWDFINNDGNTQNEPGDPTAQHNHGTYTWSALGGAASGNLYGPAYGAHFILAKTEDTSQEQPIEEDYWVAGIEWADSIGADVVSSSLAYMDWYTYPDMDGSTAVTTVAADIASWRGIVVCNAMANAGPASGTLHAPADADSILACGAVYSSGDIAYFSSRGPSYDLRIKPEVCARGVSTTCASPYDTTGYTTASGTSLSTPLIGGAAAVILSAHPDWTPMQVREAMMMSSDRASSPDNDYGWGIPDILAAIQYSFHMTGDVTGDEYITLADAVFVINYLYRNGPAPSPLFLGDVDCDDAVDAGDVIYLLNYLYKEGAEPCVH